MQTLGVVGLGTMGANLARNAARNGATVAVYNRTAEKTTAFMKAHGKEGTFIACHSLAELEEALPTPRAILLMVKAGEAVDDIIKELMPHLEKGDILIDGGNSHFRDTERRQAMLTKKGIHLLGMGVSGGEEGALHGPSLMPGGDEKSYKKIEPLLRKMAASDGDGGRCVSYVGGGGSGHFVKIVHNGIEYGLMQIIAEVYDLLRSAGHLYPPELEQIFSDFNDGVLASFLLDITAKIFRKKDESGSGYLLDLIRDAAGQKGTGKWATDVAMDVGVAIPTITAAVDARILSGDKLLRMRGQCFLPAPATVPPSLNDILIPMISGTLELSFLLTYWQGFELIAKANDEHKWGIQRSEIARLWRGGCIIRSALLPDFQQVFADESDRNTTEQETFFHRFGGEKQTAFRTFVSACIQTGVPVPALSSALAYYDSLRRVQLPQNLIQAQRDFFGAHTFERTDCEGSFHADWAE